MSVIVDNALAQITAATGVFESTTLFAQAVPGWISAAVQKALANGATAAELEPLTQLASELSTKAAAATTAMLSNTPAAEELPPVV